jgi:hypothetical protein
MRLIKKSLVGKEGSEKVKILREHLDGLPGYFQGPYGKIRRWVLDEIDRSRGRARVKHQEHFAIPKEGSRQVALVGAPNAGKSALLHALSGVQVRVAGYPFATLKPVAAIVAVNGAQLQLVEIPGIVQGASDDRGRGRSLLGAARNADVLLCVASLIEPAGALEDVLTEVELAGMEKPAGLCLTGLDAPGARDRAVAFTRAYPDLPVAVCSTVSSEGLDDVRRLVWRLARLIRVWPWRPETDGAGDKELPFVLDEGSRVADLARLIHKSFPGRVRSARVWGPSARFPGQIVGPSHVLLDEDRVELVLSR